MTCESGYNFTVVTYSDTVDFVSATGSRLNAMIGLAVGAAGVLKIVDKDGAVHTLTVAAGQWLPIRAVRINATGTTVAAGAVLAVFL